MDHNFLLATTSDPVSGSLTVFNEYIMFICTKGCVRLSGWSLVHGRKCSRTVFHHPLSDSLHLEERLFTQTQCTYIDIPSSYPLFVCEPSKNHSILSWVKGVKCRWCWDLYETSPEILPISRSETRTIKFSSDVLKSKWI